MKKLFLVSVLVFISACATQPKDELSFDEVQQKSTSSGATKRSSRAESAPSEAPAKAGSIVVDAGDVAVLEKMNKAVESYVLKNEKKNFTRLCKDKRFDCTVDDKIYPKGKKKVARTVPPYASGSKMGLQGEKRVQVKYDFYP
ncbi:hypothetical protein [Bdellovibrio bacteriovorus]|uniref:hypothetical protein n=1 Tax=Bdellovibrio bacteriovorus TaxID=959 RepID=UPI0035A5BB56